MNRSIDRATGKAKGDATKNMGFYKIVCANCHGRDGFKVRTMAPLGKIARDNPWESLHKILNGHPNERMPALRVVGAGVLADVLATIQALPEENRLISIVRGGRLYDNWYTETMSPPPATRH
ncbi:MAG: hypothetical protein QGI13_17420, partial [Rhodospirillales bacterium]|nr:hypothetical protein [Rhodospirillales bacterium]